MNKGVTGILCQRHFGERKEGTLAGAIASKYQQAGESDQDKLDPARLRHDEGAFPKRNDSAACVGAARSGRRE